MNKVKLQIIVDKVNKETIIKNIYFFDLFKTLESGQTFRYKYIDDNDKSKGVYVYYKNIVTLLNQEIQYDDTCNLIIKSCDEKVIDAWIKFFNLELDYESINNEFINASKSNKKKIEKAFGVRIIHTDIWESILTFIISANNNMKRIKYSVDLLSERYGKIILNDKKNNIVIHEIPDCKTVSKLSLEEIRDLKVGFRDKYILDAANKIASSEIKLGNLVNMNYDNAKETLMKIKGIGDKVADCINLFGLNNFKSFPVDTWIEKYMLENDLKREVSKGKTFTRKQIEEYGIKKYGDYAGIMQQYIFYSFNTNIKK